MVGAQTSGKQDGHRLFIYWLLFLVLAVGTLLSNNAGQTGGSKSRPLLIVGALVVALLVGLRFEVGADWQTYAFIFSYAGYADLDRVLAYGDWGFQALNWSVQRAGAPLWVVNLICASLFAWGLYRFALVQEQPWVTFLVAVPYLVIVVAMGYTRQAVAIGMLMGGLASFTRTGSLPRFLWWLLAATLFHKTAIVALPLVALAGRENRLVNILLSIASGVLLYTLFLDDDVDRLIRNYIEAEYSSQGAAIRVAMSLLPAIVFLLFRRRFGFPPREDLIWRNFACAAVALLPLLLLLPSSTAVDRIALYIIPLQLAVWSRLPGRLTAPMAGRVLMLVYAFLVQFIWLNYADHSRFWIPYRFVL